MRSMRFWPLHLGNRMLRMAAQFPAGNVKAADRWSKGHLN